MQFKHSKWHIKIGKRDRGQRYRETERDTERDRKRYKRQRQKKRDTG